jgi:hypothetical protein
MEKPALLKPLTVKNNDIQSEDDWVLSCGKSLAQNFR